MNAWNDLMKKHKYAEAEIEKPQFDKTRRCHDWRNYIPNELRNAWGELSYGARIAAFLVAKQQADGENWD